MPSPRILHVIDQPGPTGQTLTLRLSADLARQDAADGADPGQHAWLLVGGAPLRDAACAVGIDKTQIKLVAAPRPLPVPGAMRSIQRLLHGADRVVCWTPGAAELVSVLGRSDATPRFGQATLSAMTRTTIRRSLAQIDQDASAKEASAIGPPTPRQTVRERWGVPAQAVLIALLADQPERVDMRALLLSLAFTHESLDACDSPYRDVRLVCHPHALGRIDAMELADLLHFPQMLIQDAGVLTPWHTLAGCDLAVAPEPVYAGLSIAWAEAMGKPIIASSEPRLPELDELPGVIHIAGNAPRHLAKAVTDWAQALPEPAWAQASMA